MQISFNRSTSTIASPTNWMGEALFGDHMFQSLKRDNCLSNTLSPLSFNFLSVLFQSLKRDNCLSNRIVAAFPTATSYGFNRSSATIASPTSVSWYTRICRPCMFQSLKRDNCLSNFIIQAVPTLPLSGVSIAQARQLPLQPKKAVD